MVLTNIPELKGQDRDALYDALAALVANSYEAYKYLHEKRSKYNLGMDEYDHMMLPLWEQAAVALGYEPSTSSSS